MTPVPVVRNTPAAACPARCANYPNRGNGGVCTMYVSSSDYCGQNHLMIDGVQYGWGPNWVEDNPSSVTDCRGCAASASTTTLGASPGQSAQAIVPPASQQASTQSAPVSANQGPIQPAVVAQPAAASPAALPAARHCEGDVCVKGPPNCFGAKSGDDEDCMTCGDAQRAYAQKGWAWLGYMPEPTLFCSKWPT